MNILVSNDDGIFKEGLHALVRGLLKVEGAKIYVFAPDAERTAASMSLTTRNPIYIKEYDMPGTELAYAVSGTPVDCVRFGVDYMRERGIEPDLVCSGINHGANLGGDCWFSGTVGAATQGIMKDVPAIAFSICSHRPEAKDFEIFDEVIPAVVNKAYGHIPKFTVVNVNVPVIPREQIKGFKVCRLGRHYYKEAYTQTPDGGWKLGFDDVRIQGPENAEDLDTVAIFNGYITIGPYCIRQTLPGAAEEIESWNLEI